MHWIGKVSAWLLVPLVLGATIYTSKLILVRNSWVSKAEKLKKEYTGLATELRDNQANVDRLQHELHRATQAWGKSYPAFGAPLIPTTIQNPAAGTLAVSLGLRSDPPIREGQWLYGFEVQADGTSVYRGDFVADQVRDGEALLRPNWRVRPGDTRGWQSGNWRWRIQLPTAYPTRFDDLVQTLVRKDELLADREQSLAIQEAMIKDAAEQLKLREAELIGGPQLPQTPTLDLEYRQGLIAALEELEEARNAELVAIDHLRRSVKHLRSQIEALNSDNRELAGKLPQPPTEVSRQP